MNEFEGRNDQIYNQLEMFQKSQSKNSDPLFFVQYM